MISSDSVLVHLLIAKLLLMAYQVWQYRNGTVLVEKYTGTMELNELISNDDDWLSTIPPEVDRILALTDISGASLQSMDVRQVGEAFKAVDKYWAKTNRMKIALYTGMNCFEDFQKASTYARHGSERALSIIPFVNLDKAMNWLGLTEQEQEVITVQLQQ